MKPFESEPTLDSSMEHERKPDANPEAPIQQDPRSHYACSDPSPPSAPKNHQAIEASATSRPESRLSPVRDSRHILWTIIQEEMERRGAARDLTSISRAIGIARETLRAYRDAPPNDRWPIFSPAIARKVCAAFDWDADALRDVILEELRAVRAWNAALANRQSSTVAGDGDADAVGLLAREASRATALKVGMRTQQLRESAD